MIWAAGFVLTMIVVVYVGYPLFVRDAEPAEDALEAAIAERREKKQSGTARPKAAVATAPRGVVKCARCGSANLPEDRFCARCGAGLGERCAACGTPYEAGDVFCASCGARLAGRQA